MFMEAISVSGTISLSLCLNDYGDGNGANQQLTPSFIQNQPAHRFPQSD
jgi:hypothetical protein